MAGMHAGVRKLIVSYDIERYSGRGTRGEFAAQRRLAEILDFALQECGVPPGEAEIQEQGDGGLALLPTGGTVDDPRLIVGLINALHQGLTQMNEDLVEDARIRLRVGMDEGVVHRAAHGFAGPAVIGSCRIRDSDPVRSALARSDALLVVAAADGLYQDVLSHGYHGLPASAFTPASIQAKSFAGKAWIYLPGSMRRSVPDASIGPDPSAAPALGDRKKDQPPRSAPSLQEFLNSPLDSW